MENSAALFLQQIIKNTGSNKKLTKKSETIKSDFDITELFQFRDTLRKKFHLKKWILGISKDRLTVVL